MQYETQQDIEEIQYITFLLMARAGLKALEFYDPKTKKHGQAHMQARYVSFFHLVHWHTDTRLPVLVSPNTSSSLALLA